LRIVISSLLRNSVEALTPGGTIGVEAREITETDRRLAVFSVGDDGPGLSASEREHLFDPFYSGRQAGRGLGFGLSKAWRIVALHGGTIAVTSPESGGVKFTVYWPASTDSPGVTE
jgi:hypothetical protein